MAAIYETSDFAVVSAGEPHVCRTDGGHLILYPNQPIINRWDLDPRRAKLLMRLSMLAGEAMLVGLNERGIPVERINFQDNGNWGLGTPHGPHFHLHLYGRAKNSVHQVHGEALVIPHKATRFWENLEPLNDDDCAAIRSHIERLARETKYDLRYW